MLRFSKKSSWIVKKTTYLAAIARNFAIAFPPSPIPALCDYVQKGEIFSHLNLLITPCYNRPQLLIWFRNSHSGNNADKMVQRGDITLHISHLTPLHASLSHPQHRHLRLICPVFSSSRRSCTKSLNCQHPPGPPSNNKNNKLKKNLFLIFAATGDFSLTEQQEQEESGILGIGCKIK